MPDGLLANETFSVQQDSKGFIWISGKNGIQRYDGYRFVNFSRGGATGYPIPYNDILWMVMDAQDRLWALTTQGHVFYLDTRNFHCKEVGIVVRGKMVSTVSGYLFTDGGHHIILSVLGYGLVSYDENIGVFTSGANPFRSPEGWMAQWCWYDPRTADYWLGCVEGLARYNARSGKLFYKREGGDPILTALADVRQVAQPYVDRYGDVWLCSWVPEEDMVKLFCCRKGQLIDYTPAMHRLLGRFYFEIRNIQEDASGTLWFSGLNAYVYYNRTADSFEAVKSNLPGAYSIRYDDIRRMFTDREHNTWLSTNQGVYRTNPLRMQFKTIANRRPGNAKKFDTEVTDILQLQNDHVLVSTWGAGLFEYDADFNPVPSPVATQGMQAGEGLTWCILQRTNGDIWRGQQAGGIIIWHAATRTTSRVDDTIFHGITIRQLAEDRNGNVWIGTHGGGLVRWDAASENFSRILSTGKTIARLYADRNGDIWVLSDDLRKMDIGTGKVGTRYVKGDHQGKEIRPGTLSDIVQYDDTTYLIAGDGINILHTKRNRFTYMDSNDGLPSDYIINLVQDRKGRIWASTENGVCRIDMIHHAVTAYTEEDGVLNNNFNISASGLLRDGRIVFGTNHDLLSFDPGQMHASGAGKVQAHITGVRLMDHILIADTLSRLKALELAAGAAMTVELSGFSFADRQHIVYRLEGLEDKWMPVNKSGEAVYNYLPSGDYVFKAGVLDDGRVKGITALPVCVAPPFWRTWWFWLLLAVIAVAIIGGMYRSRMRRIQAMQSVRAGIADNLHEQVNSTLRNISVLSEIAAMKADTDIEQSRDYIDEITLKSRQMVGAMNDVLWSIDPRNDSMEKVAELMKEYAVSAGDSHDVQIDIAIDHKVKDLRLDMKKRLDLISLYRMGLMLLVKNAAGNTVFIDVDQPGRLLQVKMYGDGVILDPADKETQKILDDLRNHASSVNVMAEIHPDERGASMILEMKL